MHDPDNIKLMAKSKNLSKVLGILLHISYVDGLGWHLKILLRLQHIVKDRSLLSSPEGMLHQRWVLGTTIRIALTELPELLGGHLRHGLGLRLLLSGN
jgi:hypothetical protein